MDIIKFRKRCSRMFPNSTVTAPILEIGEDYQIRELVDIQEKIDWMVLYHREYHGNLKMLQPGDFLFNQKYLILNARGIDVGFLNLSLMVDGMLPIDFGWSGMTCGSIGYVKPQFRSNGHQHKLLEHAIKNHNCHMVQVEFARWQKNEAYFGSLGLINVIDLGIGEVFVTSDKAANEMRKRLATNTI